MQGFDEAYTKSTGCKWACRSQGAGAICGCEMPRVGSVWEPNLGPLQGQKGKKEEDAI